jgi:acyl-[acyl-carrier-protein]-phospholipid O-acyltransferase/long-chain-fatty-acid--[acyl-carrier-protein] ligase
MPMRSVLSASFRWLNATQFLGALNDNLFKLLVSFFLIRSFGAVHSSEVAGYAGLLFALPFLLFTPAAGVLADRFSKRTIVVLAKALEIVVMALGVAAFLAGSAPMLYAVLFLMSAQSALFGPAKYGIIPELVDRAQLSLANSRIVSLTYLAIIFGTFGAPAAVRLTGGNIPTAAWACILIAVAGTATSLGIGRVPASGSTRRPSWFFLADVIRPLREVRHDRYLVLAIVAAAYFSLIGAYLQLNLIPFGLRHLGLDEVDSGFLFLGAALGIGTGSLVAGRLSGRNVEFGVLPIGALGLALATLAMGGIAQWPAAAVAIVAAGLSAGLYIVPLEAFIQLRCPKDRLGEVLAANGFLSWIGVLAAAALMLLFDRLHLSPARGFVAMGALTLALTAFTVRVLPDFLVRFLAVLITRTLYRIRAVGIENLPVDGGALLVANHVSYMDALHILACQQRRIRFMMHRPIYETHKLRFLFRLMKSIPIAMEDPPKRIVESLRAARKALDDGYMVCIFAEGALTRNGLMRGFKPGFERIVRGTNHPIVPIYIGGTWGSVFSHFHRGFHARVPIRLPYPVGVVFGRPMPSDTPAEAVRQAVQELSCDYFDDRRRTRRPLGRAFVAAARRNWSRLAMTDTGGRRLTFGRALAGAIALARRIAPLTRGQEAVGLLLPPSVGGALANLALALLRKTSVNLNFTVSPEAFRSAIEQSGLRTVLSSRAFLEKIRPPADLPGLVCLEDLAAGITPARRLAALLAARLAPAGWLAPCRGFRPDDLATIIFSSGTTGEPKGVMLTHHNIRSNVEAISLVFRPRAGDAIAASLPLFHSFGYTCGLWFPLLAGMRADFHPNPLDTARIAQMIREEGCTALFTTPTFLLGHLRRAQPDDLRSLRHVITGAEKLKPRVADAFEARFGIRPREGYGTTELSPVAILSLPDEGEGPYAQSGWKAGSVGMAVPGVAVRIVDPDTGERLPTGTPGMLIVRGPNVMRGYLNRPDMTAEVVRDGWYWTGDIAAVDPDGFVAITDRLARFSKIGGEMIPHMAVEDEYLRGLGRAEMLLAVTSIADERKGERLVVLYTEAAGDPAALHALIEAAGIPNLWKPARDAYHRIDAIPMTATGKLDVKGLRRLAAERCPPAPGP